MPRKRDYVKLQEKLAATLACLLPQEVRDEYRRRQAQASNVISCFNFDHIVLHAFGGSDLWWNLDPKMIEPHREKSKLDVAIVAKAKRIDKKWIPFVAAVASGQKPPKRASKWPKRKFSQNYKPSLTKSSNGEKRTLRNPAPSSIAKRHSRTGY